MSQKKGTDKRHPFRRRDSGGWRMPAYPHRAGITVPPQQPVGLAITANATTLNGLGNVGSLSINIGTSYANDLLIAVVTTYNFVGSGAIVTSTVTDSAGLTWHLRSRTNGVNGTSFSLNQEVWWALAATPVGTAVTATFSATPSQSSNLTVFAVSGSPNPSAPWDTSSGLPALQSHMSGTNAVMSQSGVTSSTKAMLLAFTSYANNGHGNSTDPTGFTAIDDVFGNSLSVMQDYKQLTVAGANTPAWGVGQDYFQIAIDALTGDNPNAATGTIATNLTKASQSLSGNVVNGVNGTIATNLTKASLSAAGKEIFTGTVSTNLTKASIAAAGWAEIIGTATTNLSKMSIAALAATEKFVATITTNLTKASFAAVGKEVFTGTITTNLTKASFAAVAKEVFTGTVNTALSKISIAATDAEIFTGTIATHLTKASFTAAGKEVFTGTIATHLTKASLSAFGSTNVTGTAVTRLSGVAQIVSGHEGITIDGSIVTTLGPASFAASALEIMTGVAATRLGGINMASAGLEIITGAAVTRLGNENGQMVGNVVIAEEIIQGPIVMALPPFRPLILGAKLGAPGTSKWYSWRYTDS